MKPFTVVQGPAAPLLLDNIDTDVIVRIERIARHKRGEFARWAFEALRYLPDGAENPDFILNRQPFREAKILVAGANFGCGSSREMAVWAIAEFGIRCVVAESYGDIFYNNCLQNGVLAITLPRREIDALAADAARGVPVTADLQACTLSSPGVGALGFTIPASQRETLLSGLDEVGLTLRMAQRIDQFQRQDAAARPWVYAGV